MTGPVIVDEPGKSALCIGRVMLKKEKDVGGVCRRNCAGYLGESLLPAFVTERMPGAPQQKTDRWPLEEPNSLSFWPLLPRL